MSAARATLSVRERARLNLSWLLKLRWAAVVGQLATILFVSVIFGLDLPLLPLFLLIGAAGFSNAVLDVWIRWQERRGGWQPRARHTQAMLGTVMVVDILLLTTLLYYTGGPSNPFSLFYLVNIVLGAVVLRASWAWTLNVLAVLGFVVLFVRNAPLPGISEQVGHELKLGQDDWRDLMTAQSDPQRTYLLGTLVAFAATTGIIVYFVNRVTSEREKAEAELEREREQQERSARMQALATLAAGAAHELSSPLSTIAVVAKELERDLAAEGEHSPEVGEDMRLIRTEVARCRDILNKMALDAGETAGEGMVQVPVEEMIEITLEGLVQSERVHVEASTNVRATPLFVPRLALAQSMRSLLKNALDASPSEQGVELVATQTESRLTFQIHDQGAGMSPDQLVRLGEPFYTTKEPGRGMGLGLYLCREVIERLGGQLEIRSELGRGTQAIVSLPLEKPAESGGGDKMPRE